MCHLIAEHFITAVFFLFLFSLAAYLFNPNQGGGGVVDMLAEQMPGRVAPVLQWPWRVASQMLTGTRDNSQEQLRWHALIDIH